MATNLPTVDDTDIEAKLKKKIQHKSLLFLIVMFRVETTKGRANYRTEGI